MGVDYNPHVVFTLDMTEVRKAILLLKKAYKPNLVKNGFGDHSAAGSIVARSYGIAAHIWWNSLTIMDQMELRSNGWSQITYDLFMQWIHGVGLYRTTVEIVKCRDEFLKECVSGNISFKGCLDLK